MLSAIKDEKKFRIGNESTASLFFSNKLEVLLEYARASLFSTTNDPFIRRLLIVPSHSMEQWIRFQLTDRMGVATGITTTFLNRGIERLAEELFEPVMFPTQLELILRLEHELSQILKENDSIWVPLQHYLRGKPRRLMAVAKHLAVLFMRYATYAHDIKGHTWQQQLWERVCGDLELPLECLPRIKTDKAASTNLSVHLFGFSHLSPTHLHFLTRVAHHLPVSFYQLSACQEFWSDLSGENLLLNRLGKVGGQMARLFEESQMEVISHYIEPQESFALQQLQRELLHLEPQQGSRDTSIELHEMSTRYREIEVLQQRLTRLMQEGVESKEILVMAPDITPYVPYIEAFFSHFKITDLPMGIADGPLHALLLLLNLDKKRWSAPALLELFNHALFKEKMGWNEEDLLQIRAWIIATGIRWGFDLHDRDRLLRKRHCEAGMQESQATWKAGLDHLIEELALPHKPTRVDFTQAELLGELANVLEKLKRDLSQLETKKTLKDWVSYLKELSEAYLSKSEEQDALFRDLEKLERVGYLFPSRSYAFSSLEQLFDGIFGDEMKTIHPNQVQAIHFCSMLPMRAIPAKVICLIGMNESAFPRRESPHLVESFKSLDYFPTRLDYDRHLFLEALVSAREKLIMSYISEEGPSLLIDEAFPGMDAESHTLRNYSLQEIDEPVKPLYSASQPPPEEQKITPINDLLRAVRAPIRHYLYHRWEMTFYEEDRISGEEVFVLTPLQKGILRKSYDLECAVFRTQKEGDFPIGLFGQLAHQQLAEELVPVEWDLTSQVIDLTTREVSLVGKIEGVVADGLFSQNKMSVKNVVTLLPQLLLLNAVDPSKTKLYMEGGGEVRELFFNDSKSLLESLLDYYALSRRVPSFLYPEWIEGLLKGKVPRKELYDPALKWVLRGHTLPSEKEIVSTWAPWAEKLYGGLVDEWF